MSAENFHSAVLETARWWWSGDVIFLKSIERNDDKFSKDIVRDIAKTYLVIRGFTTKGKEPVKSKDRDQSVSGISALLNERLGEWPATIEKRAEFCAELTKICKEKFSQKELASAMTKLMWFARPTDWTMFDRYAADGLGVKSAPAVERMLNFYRDLHNRDHKGLLEMIRPVVNESGLDPRWTERIVDKYLMLIGYKSPGIRDYHEFYLEGLPPDTRDTLTNLARQIERKCGGHKLVNYLDTRQSQTAKAATMKTSP